MRQRPRCVAIAIFAVAFAVGIFGVASAGAATTGTLFQRLTVSWSHNNWQNHDRASFQIPGVGTGDVTCSPNTTWIQMIPSDRNAENDMWSVKFQKKDGVMQTAVKEARVYTFSTPVSTVAHGTGATTYEGFNEDTPIEKSDSGTLIGLISRRNSLNKSAGAGSVSTSIHLSWAWSGFHTSSARCRITATFTTPIGGKSVLISEGRPQKLPSDVGKVNFFNLNWHGESDYSASTKWPDSLTLPDEGTLSGVCQTGASGDAEVTLQVPDGRDPYASVTTYQGEGIDNSTVDDFFVDPETGQLGPIQLPVNGFIVGRLWPQEGAPASQETEFLISSIRKVNDPDPAKNYCEVAVQTISAPDPVL